jgi:hypothetical protein
VRLASLGLGLMLWDVAVHVSPTLTTLILPATPGPYIMTWASELRYATVFAVFAAPLTLWDTPWVLRQAWVWWQARGTIDQPSTVSHAREWRGSCGHACGCA